MKKIVLFEEKNTSPFVQGIPEYSIPIVYYLIAPIRLSVYYLILLIFLRVSDTDTDSVSYLIPLRIKVSEQSGVYNDRN